MTYKDLIAKPGLMPILFHKQAQQIVDETQLEKDFANMAYVFIQDVAPRIVEYILGFEIVERNDDGSKVVGIFGLKIGDEFYYIPAFFTNNQIKGIDSIYSRKTNMTVPLTDAWVDQILSKNNSGIIDSSPDDVKQEDLRTPDFEDILEPPEIVKGASNEQLGFAKLAATTEIMGETDPDFKSFIDGLRAAASETEINPGKSELTKYMENDLKFANCFVNTLEKDAEFATLILSVYGDPQNLIPEKIVVKQAQKKAETMDLEIVEDPCSCESSDEKADIVRTGFTIKDKRDPKYKAKIESFDHCAAYDTPTEPGEYYFEVKYSNDVIHGALFKNVLNSSKNSNYFKNSFITYIKTDKGDGKTFDQLPLIDLKKQEDLNKILNSAIPITKLNAGSSYLITDSDYRTYGKFRVDSKLKSGNLIAYSGCSLGNSKYYRSIEIDNAYSKPKLIAGDVLKVPSDLKALKLSDSYTAICPLATFDDAYEKILKAGMYSLEIKPSTGHGYVITKDWDISKTLGYKDACKKLVFDYALDYEDTKKLLKEAKKKRILTLIKSGQTVGVQPPDIQQPVVMGDSGFGTSMTYPQTEIRSGQYQGMPEVNPKGLAMNEELNKLIENAAASGQKKIFDYGAIGGLAKVYDIDNVISTAIPDMRSSLDKLGRLLFLFYWKSEDFVERFGSEKIVELEETLHGVYRSFGNLILDLMTKEIDGGI